MKKEEITRDFSMPLADLAQLGDTAVSLITRDAAELLTYGIDNTVKTWIATKTQELKDFPTDEEVEGAVVIATQKKDVTADTVKVIIRSVMTRAKNALGEADGRYRRFNHKGMDKLNDRELVILGKRVGRTAQLYLADIAPKGLTQLMIDELNAAAVLFDEQLDIQEDAVRVRDIATDDRLLLANLLYNKIVEVFEDGKDYWYTRSEAKYNDYVLYESGATPTPTPTPTGVFKFDIDETILADIFPKLAGNASATGVEQLNFDHGDGFETVYTLQNGILTGYTVSYNTAGVYHAEVTEITAGAHRKIGGIQFDNCKMKGTFSIPSTVQATNIEIPMNPLLTDVNMQQESYANLVSLVVFGCGLLSINENLIGLDNSGKTNGFANFSGGTNAAPSGLGIAAKNSLIAKGWTVITN